MAKDGDDVKIQEFQNGGQLGAPASEVSHVQYNNAGAQVLAKSGEGIVKAVMDGTEQLFEQVQVSKVLEANNAYNTKMAELNMKIRQNKEGGAYNALQLFDEEEKKIRTEIESKYKNFIGYGKMGAAYNNMIEKDYGTRRAGIIGYQMEELEKNNATQYGNSLQATLDMASSNYKDIGTVDGAMRRTKALAAARFFNYGDERIAAETRKAQGAIASNLISTAINNSDWTGANGLLVNYGSSLEPDKRSGFAKLVNEQIKTNKQISTFSSLYAKFSGADDEAGYLAAAEKEYEATKINNTYNMKLYSGDTEHITEAMKTSLPYVGGILQSMGITDPEITSGKREAGQVGNAGEKSYHVSGNAIDIWIGDNVDREKGNEIAAKFAPYFKEAMYEMEGDATGATGNHLHLAGYEGGLQLEKSSPADKQKFLDAATAHWNKQQAIKTNIANPIYNNGQQALTTAFLDGNTNEESLMALASRCSLNTDGTVNMSAYNRLMIAAKKMAGSIKRGTSSNGGTGILTLSDQMELQDIFDHGGMDEAELIARTQASGLTDSKIMSLVKENRKAQKKEGEYDYPWSDLEKMLIKNKSLPKDPGLLYGGAKDVAKRWIREKMQANGGVRPTTEEVYSVLEESLTTGTGQVYEKIKTWTGTKQGAGYSQAELSNKGIYTIESRGEDEVSVYFKGSEYPVMYQLDDFNKMMGRE